MPNDTASLKQLDNRCEESSMYIKEDGFDFTLNEEQTMIVDMVRKFVRQEINPLEKDLDPDADEVDQDTYAAGRKPKLWVRGLDTPPEYGGPDISMATRTLIAIECSQHRAGLYVPCYNAFGGARQAQLFEATDAQKEKYLYPMLKGEKKVFLDYQNPQVV